MKEKNIKLKLGDTVYRPLFRLVRPRHYGVVIQEETIFSEAIIRTVWFSMLKPINQTQSEFADNKTISILPYPSELSRWQVAKNAINVTEFKYDLLNNNCDNFYRRAHGLADFSPQAVVGGIIAVGLFLWMSKGKNPISV